jgi:hypothetical protein
MCCGLCPWPPPRSLYACPDKKRITGVFSSFILTGGAFPGGEAPPGINCYRHGILLAHSDSWSVNFLQVRILG